MKNKCKKKKRISQQCTIFYAFKTYNAFFMLQNNKNFLNSFKHISLFLLQLYTKVQLT